MLKHKIYIIIGIIILAVTTFLVFPKFTKNFIPEDKKDTQIKILFVGDIMMDRSIRTKAEKFGYDFYYKCVAPTFSNYDFVIANLESTVTNYPSVSVGKPQEDYNHFRFTIDPKALIAMKNSGINVVGVDNNHIFDFGREGIEMTRKNVADAGLNYFGDPIDDNYSNLRLEKNGVAFNLVSFNEFFGSSNKTLNNIEKVKATNIDEPIIIFSHWGDEYIKTPDRVKKWAYQFIDAGADLIVGMHPHVIQETENYNNVFIAYSLGNFIFDQYFSDEVKRGASLEVILDKGGIVSTGFLSVKLDQDKRPCVEY